MSLKLSFPSSLTPHKTSPPLHPLRPLPSLARLPVKCHEKARIRAQQCPFTTSTTTTPPPLLSELALPPGPWRLPFIGSLHHLISPLPFRKLRDLADSHGPVFHLRLGEIDTVVVSSREAVHEVMKKQDLNFLDSQTIIASNIIIYGCSDMVFSPYGPYWRQLRHLCITELLSAKRVKSFGSLRAEECLNMVKNISNLASTGATVPLSAIVLAMINNTVSRASFGSRFGNQERVWKMMQGVMEMMAGFSVAEFFPSLKVMDSLSGYSDKLRKVHGELDEILTAIVGKHEVKGREEKEEEEDLVDVLLRLKDREDLEVPITMENIKAVIADMFIAGTETSSTVIEWAIAELIRQPNIMRKAQQEVREIVKGKTIIEEKDFNELHYLKLIIKETLRLHPPGPLLFPRICKETCQVSGYKIESGTSVIINLWALGRDPKYWEDPDMFKPERFEGSSINFKGNNMEYIPFSAGKRICPGASFGLANVELAMAHLLFYFDWKLPTGMKIEDLDMTESFGVTAALKSHLHLVAIPHFRGADLEKLLS